MPDEAREIVFPRGIPVHLINSPNGEGQAPLGASVPSVESAEVSVQAEGGLRSEAKQIEEQARQARPSDEAENLLQR